MKFVVSLMILLNSTYILANTKITNIHFSEKIADDQYQDMLRDLELLNNFNFSTTADELTLKVMGLKDLNSDSAKKWLEDRVYFVSEDLNNAGLRQILFVLKEKFKFDHKNVKPEIEKSNTKPSREAVTVMSNTGAALYLFAKELGSLIGVKVKTKEGEQKYLKLSSPRVGMITVGPGLFLEKFMYDKINKKAESNSLFRLATFFHEARHSDGNKKHIAFIHAICPDGHDFQGYNACDRNLNGPYTVGAQMTKEFLVNCETCTDQTKEKMKLRYLDSLERVIKVTKKIKNNREQNIRSKHLDPLPEGERLE